jgi:hypothetical protein
VVSVVQDITRWPKIECSGREVEERDGWEGDPFNFNFYKVMLISTHFVLIESERKDDTTDVYTIKISERAGQWALPSGPRKRSILSTEH